MTARHPQRKSQSTTTTRDSSLSIDKHSSGHSSGQRPALVTISQNTRRNKSKGRGGVAPALDDVDDDSDPVVVGRKRKRPQINTENALAGTSQPRSAKRLKRSASPVESSDDEDEDGAMDTANEDEEQSEQFYLQSATRTQLLKLKKDQLVSLYREANISRPISDPDSLTRAAITQALIQARIQPRRGAQNRAPKARQAPFTPDSDDNRGRALRAATMRRTVTEPDFNDHALSPLGRSFSLNTLTKNNTRRERRNKIASNSSTMSDEPPPVTPISPPITRKRVQSDPKHLFSYDEVTEDSEDELPHRYEPSPRRLRPRGEQRSQDSGPVGRHLPVRAGKPKIGELQEDETDFDSEEEGVPASSAVDTDRDEEVDEDEEEYDDDEDDLSPRKLRNGKVIIPEEPEADDEEEEEGNSDEDAEGEDDNTTVDEYYMEEDEEVANAEGEREGSVDDEVDLSEETVKTLTRYRRDELVRLCESRNLETEGTKPQLAKALLEWRDSRQPSSSGASTVRAPSIDRRQNGKKKRPPVLDRSDRIHVSQPQTPPLSVAHNAENVSGVTVIGGNTEEPELEFDLASLGLEDKEIPYEKLVKKEKIGSGGFKDVYSGTLFGNRRVAIAEFRGTLTAMDIKELQLLRDLHHENIVRFYGVSVPENTKDTPVVMINEFCHNGDLFDYIRNESNPGKDHVLPLMLDVASGLEYLHTHKPSIIHRDCKSPNILITKQGRAKIADFGLAKVKQSTRSMVISLVGTVNWQAPELWHAHPKYDHKVDVFSCAMVFWEILQWHLADRKYPWEGMNEHAIYDAVGAKRQRPSTRDLKRVWGAPIVALVERMWSQDPKERPTMSQVVAQLESILADDDDDD